MMDELFLSRFTPSLMKPETLKAILVQRWPLVNRLLELIRRSVLTEDKHYILLYGPRGIGKTHLVSLIYHLVREDTGLGDRLLIAWLREDEYVASFLHLLIGVLRSLLEEHGGVEFKREYDKLFALTPKEAEPAAEELLRRTVGDRSLLVIAENLDELFNGLGQDGQQKLRAFIQNHGFFTILATSQSLFDGVSKQKSPFYGFFERHNLERLSFEEAVEMLVKIADLVGDKELALLLGSPRGRARVRAVHELAGGNPRVYFILAQFLTCEALVQLVDPLMRTLDDLTPYYQDRMNFLSPQQRKIMDYLCDKRGAVPVKDIAQDNFLTHQTTSGQLKKLREMGYVLPYNVGRESYYELSEPLMRLSLEVKKMRGEPVRLLVEFLRLWYSRQELTTRLNAVHPTAESERAYLVQALEVSKDEPEDPRFAASLKAYEQHVADDNFEQALLAAEELIDMRGYASDRIKRATCLEKLGRHAESEQARDEAFEHDPTDAAGWRDRASVSLILNRFEDALEAGNRALDMAPADGVALGVRAHALHELGRYSDALASYERAIELIPDDAVVWNNRGVTLVHLERREDALCSYDKALELKPDESLCWRNRSDVLQMLGRFEDALVSVDKALELDADDAVAWNIRGVTLAKLGRTEDALCAYDKALELKPDESLYWRNRSVALRELGRFEDVLLSLDKAVELNADDAVAWNTRGVTLVKLGRTEDALSAYDKALELKPDESLYWRNRGDVLRVLGRFEDALVSLGKAIELDAGDAYTRLCRARCLILLGRYDEAAESCTRALPHVGDDSEGWDLRAELLDCLGRYEEALSSSDRALEAGPEDASSWGTRAILLYRLGRVEESLICLNRSLELAPANAEAWANGGVALSAQGRFEEALASFDKALELDPQGDDFHQCSNRAVALMSLGRWDEGIAALRESLNSLGQCGGVDSGEVAIVRNLLVRTSDPEIWRQHIPVWIELFEEKRLVPSLGHGLVRSIRTLAIPRITEETARAWRDVWQELGSSCEALRSPLRLLDAGVRYREKPDPRILLSLPIEERNLLRPILGIGAAVV